MKLQNISNSTKIIGIILLMTQSCAESNFNGSGQKFSAKAKTPSKDASPDDAPVVVSDEGTIESLDLCSSSAKKTVVIKLDFPADTTGCAWGKNGNAAHYNSDLISAVESHYLEINLPSTSKSICDMNISTTTPNFTIDDEAFVTIAEKTAGIDYLIYSDWFSMANMGTLGMSKSNEIYIFDKSKLMGFNWRVGAPSPAYECAKGVSCDGNKRAIANGGIAGAMAFSAGKDFLTNLPETFLKAKTFNFGLWNDGNKHASDCQNSAISFDIKVDYLE